MGIIEKRKIFISLSGLFVAVSVVFVAVFGLNLGIDFTGGSLLEVEFSKNRPAPAVFQQIFSEIGVEHLKVQFTGEKGVILRFREVNEETHQAILRALESAGGDASDFVSEKRFDSIGPVIGGELKNKVVVALITAMIAIILYIAWTFRRVSKPVSSWKYGVVAILALIHDVAIPIGVFALLGFFGKVEIGILFVTALLTILGFSVHDTIVVFDRIRENIIKLKNPEPYAVVVGRSVKETITRSINTSLTVILVLVPVFLWGGETTRYFALALMIGVVAGTYSSIFLASPLLVIWERMRAEKS